MRISEILCEKQRKRRKPAAPKVRYGYWYGGAVGYSGDGDSGDGGGDGGGGE